MRQRLALVNWLRRLIYNSVIYGNWDEIEEGTSEFDSSVASLLPPDHSLPHLFRVEVHACNQPEQFTESQSNIQERDESVSNIVPSYGTNFMRI